MLFHQSKFILFVIVALLGLLLLSGASPVAADTPTAVPPATTSVNATATVISPTGTRVSPPTVITPTVTIAPPTATRTTVPPTATAVPPTPIPPTATRIPPTATRASVQAPAARAPRAPAAVWTAYNDSAGTTGGNTTAYTISGTTSGLLRNYSTGANTTVTATFTTTGSPSLQTGNGAATNSGTDAYNTFNGFANMVGVINYGNSSGWSITLTLSGLDPTRTYTFATTANRNDSTYTARISRFTISDMSAATNAGTTGVTAINNESVAFSTGFNTVNGYVARWTGIQPGADGDFVITTVPHTSEYRAYGPSVFMLQEEDANPTITTTGTPNAFSSLPGSPSAEQSYTVSGTNLTDNIVITAPTDFQISTTSGTGFTSSLTLTRSGSTVATTTIYVRFNRSTVGASSGNLTHTSTGATPRNVAVSGTASYTSTVTFQYGVSGYTGTVDTFIRGTTEGNTNFSANTGLEWDENSGTTTDEIALIRFTGIFNSEGGPIPNGATIISATLRYMTTDLNSGSTANGNPANVYESLVNWTGTTVTYNNFGGEAGVQADEYNSTLIASAIADALSTQYTISVTASLQRWSNGTANYGWIFLPTAEDGVTIYSSDFATVAYHPLLTVAYTTGSVNRAPNQPGLVQPLDDATGVSTSPTLEVTVTDPDSNPMNVTFYGRATASAPGADFTIVVLPDTQNMATSYPAIFNSMTQWIANNRTSANIVFATAVGDIVNTASSSLEYARADTAYDLLDTGGVSYSVGPGNHDMGTGSLYPNNFGTSRFSGMSYYGGSYDNYNNYYLFSASGMDFILINLQYSPSTAILDWADARLKEYSSRRAIVEQHDILNTNDTWVNQTSYNSLRDNPNLFLMLSGHMHTPTDGAAYFDGTGTDGHTIHITMQDYQDYPNGGNGYLRIYRFSPANNTIYMTTYSPNLNASITTSPDEMNLAYNMTNNVFTVIGTANNVPSGTNGSVTWSGLVNNTEYEWYTVISDGSLSTTGATTQFRTRLPTAVTLSSFIAFADCSANELLITLGLVLGIIATTFGGMKLVWRE